MLTPALQGQPVRNSFPRFLAIQLPQSIIGFADISDKKDLRHLRDEWQIFPKTTEAQRLIFLGETGVKTNMTRLYRRSLSASYKFLPAYSPDLDPIEKMWSKIKQILRGLKARTPSDLYSAVGKAWDMITADAQGWFMLCG